MASTFSGGWRPARWTPWPRRLGWPRATAATAAFAGLLQQELLPAAPTTDAVGPEMYRATATAFLGADVDPVAVAEWGWKELDRIDGEIDELGRDLDPAGRQAAIAGLDADPHRRLDDDDAIRDWLEDSVRFAADATDGVHADLPEEQCRLDRRRRRRHAGTIRRCDSRRRPGAPPGRRHP